MKDLWKWFSILAFLVLAITILVVIDGRKISSLQQQVEVLQRRADEAEEKTAEIKSHVVDLGNWTVWVNASIYECGCAHKDQPSPEEP